MDFEVTILSARRSSMGPAQGCLIELEDVVAEMLDASLLEPTQKWRPNWLPARLRKPRYQLEAPMVERGRGRGRGDRRRLLFVVGLNLGSLEILTALPGWRSRFDTVAAYVFDAFEAGRPSDATAAHEALLAVDRIFVPMRAAVDSLAERGVKAAFMPMAADVQRFGCGGSEGRSIDVMAYGRQDRRHVDVLERNFNRPGSGRLLYQTVLRGPSVTDHAVQRRQFWRLLAMSRIALAYDVMTTGEARFPYSIVSQRWFESLAAGCAVLGRRPRCSEADELLDWEDATIELPDDPEAAVAAVEALLAEPQRLASVHHRNHHEMLLRHDWRHRVVAIMEELGISVSDRLLSRWRQRHREASAA